MIRIKICGITREADALHAAACGADLVGFVFAESPRRVEVDRARAIALRLEREHPHVARVGIFVDPAADALAATAEKAHLTHLQIHGARPARMPQGIPWIAAIGLASGADARPPEGDPWAVLVEPKLPVGRAGGGTGTRFPWEWARELQAPTRLFVAGGLDGGSVAGLLRVLIPFGVDASSRLESGPGIKDPEKVREFIRAVRLEEQRRGGAA